MNRNAFDIKRPDTIAPETLVTFRKPFAEARRKSNPQTWFAEGVVGMVIRADDLSQLTQGPRRSGGPGRPRRIPTPTRREIRYFILWELPNGGTMTNYLPASAIKEIR